MKLQLLKGNIPALLKDCTNFNKNEKSNIRYCGLHVKWVSYIDNSKLWSTQHNGTDKDTERGGAAVLTPAAVGEFRRILATYLTFLQREKFTRLRKLREAQASLPIAEYRQQILTQAQLTASQFAA